MTTKGIERWHCDYWYQVVRAAMAGHPDHVPLDYHPAMSHPAISRYGATSPELLGWFREYNQGRPYAKQVKPFGFLLSLYPNLQPVGEEIVDELDPKRRVKTAQVRPIALYDTDRQKVIASAFDRVTGAPVPASCLKSYAEALAQYHLHPESKFRNADYLDTGTTLRRHVQMVATRHIGKEAHDWERQASLGLNTNSEVSYGGQILDHQQVVELARSLMAGLGKRAAAVVVGLSAAKLSQFVSGKPFRGRDQLAVRIAPKLLAATAASADQHHRHQDEISMLRGAIASSGLRQTARQLGIDPSNLRRKLMRTGATDIS